MQLQVKGKNVDVSESMRSYAEQKLRKLETQLAEPTQVEVELAVEKNRSIADRHVAEATIWTKGPTIRARESSADFHGSIDQLAVKLDRQVKRYREKRRDHRNGHAEVDAIPVLPNEDSPLIVKTKQFVLEAMTPEDAVEQLELIGHDFFLFRSSDSGELSIVYRRRDGNFGLIEPQGPA